MEHRRPSFCLAQLCADQGQWQPNSYEGYISVAVDLTAFWRPRLKGLVGKFFHRLANRSLKGIGFGLVVQVGRVGDQRFPLLRRILSCEPAERSESQLKRQILEVVARSLGEHEVLVHDAGASIADMQAAGVPRYVVRMALNCTARRNQLPAPKARGRPPEYGKLVRPLPRTYKGRTLPAIPPDVKAKFPFDKSVVHSKGAPFGSTDGRTW
jgi:hypothetical protein